MTKPRDIQAHMDLADLPRGKVYFTWYNEFGDLEVEDAERFGSKRSDSGGGSDNDVDSGEFVRFYPRPQYQAEDRQGREPHGTEPDDSEKVRGESE